MTASQVSRIGGGALAGAVIGVLLHFVFGISLFSAPPARSPAQEAAPKASAGVLEKERLAAAHQKRVDSLAKAIGAAEQECADLKTRLAATPAPPLETPRDVKNRRFGGIIVKIIKMGGIKTRPGGRSIELRPENAAEMQRMMGELLNLAVELGIDLQDQSAMFRNPQLLAGMYEGILTECGVDAEGAALQELRAAIAGRIAAAPQPPSAMNSVNLGLQIQEEFLERFGRKLMEKDPTVAALLGNLGSSSTVTSLEATTAVAAVQFLKDVSKSAGLSEAQSAAVRPAFESWAAQYAALLADARTRYGDKVVEGLRNADPVGKTPDEQYAHLRDRVRLQARIVQLQSATLDAVAQQLGGEAAQRLSKFDKSYYDGRLKP
jgi:hypothetical protein